MKVIVYFLGFVYIAIGSIFILYTRESIDALKKLIQEIPLKVLSALPAIFGILFFIAALASTFPWFFRVIGIIAIIEAVVTFTNPYNIYSRLLDWYFDLSDQTQRLFGIISIIFGTAILTWIK
ncbi:MAG: hypothetical protein Q7U40_08625 [Desulfatirhabdiaceae bacterium]|nr:hypothetical protein [Desulfatirhabdiaceae bacterium]